MSGLLAAIVASRRLQPEPVATEALVHLCATSVSASLVLRDLLSEVCPGATTHALVITGQVIDPSMEGRPDLVAADETGVRLVVEAKFDAELTAAQLSGAYAERLPAGVQGALVFLVPADRMQNVWSSATAALVGVDSPQELDAPTLAAGIAARPLPAKGHVLAVLSWESLLNRLEAAVAKHSDSAAAAELTQIAGLVKWRTRTGWSPTTPGDLPQRAGRQLSGLSEMVKTVSSTVSSAKPRHGGGDGGPGRYIKTPAGKSIWFGIWFGWWDQYGPGPLWAQVKASASGEVGVLSEALTASGIQHYPRPTLPDVIVPIGLPAGAEQSITEADLRAQLIAIATAVDAAAVEVVEDEDPSENAAE